MSERNRILIIGGRQSGKLSLIKKLTGSVPEIQDQATNHSSLSHQLEIKNKYYSAKVDVWIDEFEEGDKNSEESSGVEEWVNEFTSEPAKEVRDVLGAVIYTFNRGDRQEIEKIGKFIDILNDEEWDGVAIAVSKGGSAVNEELEDSLFESGFEYINGEDTNTKGDHGEDEIIRGGIERVREALEVFPWTGELQELEDEAKTEAELPQSSADATFEDLIRNMSKPILNEEGSEESIDKFDSFLANLRKARGKNSLRIYSSYTLT